MLRVQCLAAQRIKDLCECIDRHEPKNASLYYEVSRTCARLSGRHPAVLGEALKLVERARKLAPEVASYVAEQGYQQSLAGDYAAAIQTYRLAAQLDDANTSSMFGTVYCQLMGGELADAAQQVDFLNEVGVDKSAELVFLTALTVWRRESDRERSCFLLDQVCFGHEHPPCTSCPSIPLPPRATSLLPPLERRAPSPGAVFTTATRASKDEHPLLSIRHAPLSHNAGSTHGPTLLDSERYTRVKTGNDVAIRITRFAETIVRAFNNISVDSMSAAPTGQRNQQCSNRGTQSTHGAAAFSGAGRARVGDARPPAVVRVLQPTVTGAADGHGQALPAALRHGAAPAHGARVALHPQDGAGAGAAVQARAGAAGGAAHAGQDAPTGGT